MTAPRPGSPIVILTGAGISKESGLSTFRDADGIWSRVRVEDVATPDAFKRRPDQVIAFYNMRRELLLKKDVRPNAAHRALARLEAAWPGEVLVVTQNVDDLHERAGSRNVVHMHGTYREARCHACGMVDAWDAPIALDHVCAACGAVGQRRPNVVWFGEMPMEMERIQGALMDCDAFVSVGTSGNVYPAAGFVQIVRTAGVAHTVELNLEPSEGAGRFAERHYGPASEVVPAWVDGLLETVDSAD